jgi:hypothetical protein
MQNKVILPVLLGILIIGITQFTFAEEAKVTHIEVDDEKFQQPSSKYNYQEIVFLDSLSIITEDSKLQSR